MNAHERPQGPGDETMDELLQAALEAQDAGPAPDWPAQLVEDMIAADDAGLGNFGLDSTPERRRILESKDHQQGGTMKVYTPKDGTMTIDTIIDACKHYDWTVDEQGALRTTEGYSPLIAACLKLTGKVFANDDYELAAGALGIQFDPDLIVLSSDQHEDSALRSRLLRELAPAHHGEADAPH